MTTGQVVLSTDPGATVTHVRYTAEDRTVMSMDLNRTKMRWAANAYNKAVGLMTEEEWDPAVHGRELVSYGHRGRPKASGWTSSMSLADVAIRGEMIVNISQRECDMHYYVLTGEGYFVTSGGLTQANIGDTLFAPKKAPYRFGGYMELLAIAAPAWSPGQEETSW